MTKLLGSHDVTRAAAAIAADAHEALHELAATMLPGNPAVTGKPIADDFSDVPGPAHGRDLATVMRRIQSRPARTAHPHHAAPSASPSHARPSHAPSTPAPAAHAHRAHAPSTPAPAGHAHRAHTPAAPAHVSHAPRGHHAHHAQRAHVPVATGVDRPTAQTFYNTAIDELGRCIADLERYLNGGVSSLDAPLEDGAQVEAHAARLSARALELYGALDRNEHSLTTASALQPLLARHAHRADPAGHVRHELDELTTRLSRLREAASRAGTTLAAASRNR